MINDGYCTTNCIVGGNPCPSGWVCDNLQPNAFQLPDMTVVNVSKENVGTPGVCMPACTLAADAGGPIVFGGAEAGVAMDAAVAKDGSVPSDGGSAADAEAEGGTTPVVGQGCLGSSACELQTPAGPDCVP